MFGLQRDSKRYHGHHLTPQDANADRTRRKRYVISLDGKKRTDHLPDRGYRSDDESKRRHRYDGDEDRHRASSAHRPKELKHRQPEPCDTTERHRSTGRVKSRSKEQYGEHRFDNSYPTQHIYSTSIPATSELPSYNAVYGDHRVEFSAHTVPTTLRHQRPPMASVEVEFGEHRFVDEEQVAGASSTTKPFHQDTRRATDWSLPERPSINEPAPASIFRNESNTRANDHDDITGQGTRSPINNQRIRHVSLPSRVQELAPTHGDPILQEGFNSRPSTSAPSEAFSADAKLPRLSVSRYPSDFGIPTGAVSAAHTDKASPQSVSGASTVLSRMPPRSPSLSGSGVLGSKVYLYQPLQDFEIRLVKVLPERMWKLKCEVIHVPLYSAPEYTAISVSHRHKLQASADIKLL